MYLESISNSHKESGINNYQDFLLRELEFNKTIHNSVDEQSWIEWELVKLDKHREVGVWYMVMTAEQTRYEKKVAVVRANLHALDMAGYSSPKMISTRAKGVEAIVKLWRGMDEYPFQIRRGEAHKIAAKMNAELIGVDAKCP